MVNTVPMGQYFTVGGTLPLDAVYVIRPADEQLLHATLAGEYCNVLTPRQMGKSSLMVRTVNHLRQEGVRTAAIDLTKIGTELRPDEWYLGLVTYLKDELELEIDETAWWDARAQQGAVQRFSDFLRDVILKETTEPVVIFIDEIDSTLGLPFTDDFFAAIRAAYNARASDPAYKRLTFVLLGVVHPADLIKDRSRTPYNIGLSIDLQDFTLKEASTLLPGLISASSGQAKAILERVLYWTGGHPYLTQKVCAEIVDNNGDRWTDGRIDQLVRRLFLSDEARKESNIQYVRDRIHENSDREKLLRVYRQVISKKTVLDEERDPAKSQLKLTGLVKVTAQGTLTVRNRIYETVFDVQWVKDTMPKLTSTRITIISVAVALIALTVAVFLLYRQQNADQIRAETYTREFQNAQSAAVRVTNLAGLFKLGDEFAVSARDLFFALNDGEQLAMFANLTAPEQVGEDLQIVVKGLYTRLENNDQHNTLLQVMAENMEKIRSDFPDSSILSGEINAWLEGRTEAGSSHYEEAVKSYTRAIEYADEDPNPAIHLDRALAYTATEQYADALADLERVTELDPGRLETIMDIIQANLSLHDYLVVHQEDYPTLSESIE